MQKLAELSPHLQGYSATVLLLNNKVVLLDKEKTRLEFDVVLLWSEDSLARAYAASYPSLQQAVPAQMKIRSLVDLFKGRVEYYMLDRPAKEPTHTDGRTNTVRPISVPVSADPGKYMG